MTPVDTKRDDDADTIRSLRNHRNMLMEEVEHLTDQLAGMEALANDRAAARDAALARAEIAEGRWIACSERMPEDGREVLICYDSAGGPRVTSEQMILGRWTGCGEYATHWMQLPDTPAALTPPSPSKGDG